MRYFIAVAEELNFTRAAERCSISQPPLSRAIALLEEEIGAPLFKRDKHHVSLTPSGVGLLEDSRRALEAFELAFKRARQIAQGEAGCLTVALGGAMVYSLTPRLILQFKDAYPDVEFAFRALAIPYQLVALREGEIDLAIVRIPVDDDDIQTLPVHDENIMLAVPRSHPACSRHGPIKLSSLRNDSFVTYPPSRGFGFHADLLALFRHVGFIPHIKHEVPTTEAVVGLVGCGEGLALIPASASAIRVTGVEFRKIDLSELPGHLTRARIGLAWHKSRASHTVLNFVAHTKRCMMSETDTKKWDVNE